MAHRGTLRVTTVAPAAIGPWPKALHRADLVADVEQPQDLAGVVAVARSGRPWLPVGAGRDGGARPTEPVTLVTTRSLPVRVSIDDISGIAQVSGGARWSDVEARAAETGWTVRHLVDIDERGTVGGTLARRTLLPALWMAGTARGACIGLEAIGPRGQRYRYKEAPRTASGPDFRALWFGSEGAAGLVTRASIELARRHEAQWWLVPTASVPVLEQRLWLDRYAGRATVRGGDAAALLWCVRGAGALVDHANAAMAKAGEAASEPTPLDGAVALAAVPWSAWSEAIDVRASALLNVSVHAAGPTHVVLRAQHPSRPDVARRWADRMAQLPLSRISMRGALDEERPASTPARIAAEAQA